MCFSQPGKHVRGLWHTGLLHVMHGSKAQYQSAGQADTFAVVRQLLPGPYTFILSASKSMPRVVLPIAKAKQKKKSKQRATVGVRMPDEPVCQALLQSLDRCAPDRSHALRNTCCSAAQSLLLVKVQRCGCKRNCTCAQLHLCMHALCCVSWYKFAQAGL